MTGIEHLADGRPLRAQQSTHHWVQTRDGFRCGRRTVLASRSAHVVNDSEMCTHRCQRRREGTGAVRSPESKRVTDWSRRRSFRDLHGQVAEDRDATCGGSVMADRKPQPVDLSPATSRRAVLARWSMDRVRVGRVRVRRSLRAQRFPVGRQMADLQHGGTRPRWRTDGREIFFLSAGRVMAVDIARDSVLSHGGPQYRVRHARGQ